MRILSKAEFQAEAEPILQRIFISDDPFYPQPFAPDVPVKRILFDWKYKYVVDPPLLDGLVMAAARLGDTGFYFSSLWRGDSEQSYAWYIPFSEILTYNGSDSPIGSTVFSEQVLFSPQGQWGIMTTHEFHMLLGGTQIFVNALAEVVPDLNDQVFAFLEYWKDYKVNHGTQTDAWLPGLMRQVYGNETAEKMLEEAGLP